MFKNQLTRIAAWALAATVMATSTASPVHALGFVDTVAAATQETSEPGKPVTPTQPVAPVKPATTQPAVPAKQTAPGIDKSKYSYTFYQLKAGDTIAKVVKDYGITLQQLMALNPSVNNPHKLKPGYQLIVGRKPLVAPVTAAKPVTPVTPVKPVTPVTPVTPAKPTAVLPGKLYLDGTYRGSFSDGGYEQVGIEFKLKQQQMTELKFYTLTYKGVDYLKATDAPTVQLKELYQLLANSLLNTNLSAQLEALYKPGTVVAAMKPGVDATTGATLRSGKLISAVRDGLNRGPYALAAPTVSYDDGIYRGDFSVGGQQVVVEFELKGNVFEKLSYRVLQYKGVDYKAAKDGRAKLIQDQFNSLLTHLKGKDVRTSVTDLYQPARIAPNLGEGADAVTGATVRSGKVVSAIQGALGRGVYAPTGTLTETAKRYEQVYQDGTYRGSYLDGGIQSVGIEFTLKSGVIDSIKYRVLAYKDVDYLKAGDVERVKVLEKQYQTLIAHLKGKPLTEVMALYKPGDLVKTEMVGADAVTGATLRSGKVVSAIADALNRGAYSK